MKGGSFSCVMYVWMIVERLSNFEILVCLFSVLQTILNAHEIEDNELRGSFNFLPSAHIIF